MIKKSHFEWDFFVLSHIHALVTEADLDDVGTGCWYFYAGFGIVKFADGNHLPLHVHDGVSLGEVWRGFVHDNFEFESAGHSHVEVWNFAVVVRVFDT